MTALASVRYIRNDELSTETEIERLWHALEHLAGRVDLETERLSRVAEVSQDSEDD